MAAAERLPIYQRLNYNNIVAQDLVRLREIAIVMLHLKLWLKFLLCVYFAVRLER